MAQIALNYLILSIFFALFGAVYEYFSHEVFSYYMLYAFAIPLVLGALPFLVLSLGRGHLPGRAALNLWHSAIATLTVGCIFKGALEIYGTSNKLMVVYWIAGGCLIAAAIVSDIISFRAQPEAHRKRGFSK